MVSPSTVRSQLGSVAAENDSGWRHTSSTSDQRVTNQRSIESMRHTGASASSRARMGCGSASSSSSEITGPKLRRS